MFYHRGVQSRSLLSPPFQCRHWIVFLECWFWHASLFQVSQPHRLKVALITVISQLSVCTWKNPYRMRDSQPTHAHSKLYFGYFISTLNKCQWQSVPILTFELTSSKMLSSMCRIIFFHNRISGGKDDMMIPSTHSAPCVEPTKVFS